MFQSDQFWAPEGFGGTILVLTQIYFDRPISNADTVYIQRDAWELKVKPITSVVLLSKLIENIA